LKIEKINDDKLKITLDIDDLKNNNLDARSFLKNSPETQDFFWDVMQEAEKKYGFSIDESMIRVDARVAETGMFTLVVTKTSKDLFSGVKTIHEDKPVDYKLSRIKKEPSSDKLLYRFACLDDLLAYTECTSKSDNSTLYVYNKNYYLLTSVIDDVIADYATLFPNIDSMLATLYEYGKIVYKCNAIENIKKLKGIS
jgi:adapter protein MecA 1/2